MKKLFLALGILIGANLFASTTPNFIKEVSAKTVVVNLNNWKQSNITITIEDLSGNVVFSEKIEKPQSNRQYNLSKMNDGDYTISIENKQKVAVQKVKIKNDQLLVDATIEETYKPIFLTNGNVWAIQALALAKNAEIKIYDEDSNIVFSEKIEKPTVERRYNVTKLSSGNYEIVYSINGKTYSQSAFKK